MNFKKYLGLVRLLVLVLLVSWGMNQGLTQTKNNAQSKPDKKATQAAVAKIPPSKAWIKDPNQVMPMRQMTNAERRKAAARNADCRAAAQRNRSVSNTQGVQQ